MADGDPLLIGQSNSASSAETLLDRFGNTDTFTATIRGRTNSRGIGVFGDSATGIGVRGINRSGTGVGVSGTGNVGVSGTGTFGVEGVAAPNGIAGVFGQIGHGIVAGLFDGPVIINGHKYFLIDHPLDPENKYLAHTSVESSEMKNVYDGVARLDKEGSSWVELPEWFETLNADFSYQLTAVGGSAPDLHVAEEISENRFKIAGGQEGMKVCWQVTGSRKDRWAAANPFEVEQEKREEDRGRYLHPDLYDAPEEQKVLMLRAAAASVTGEEAGEH